MVPIQVLINNLLYDLSQTAVLADNVDEEYTAAPGHKALASLPGAPHPWRGARPTCPQGRHNCARRWRASGGAICA